jgi:D-amino-acid dehydrogenase
MAGGLRTLVVGGGIVGLSAAWYLARRGAEVRVVTDGDPAQGASAGNAGILALGHLPLPGPGVQWRALRWMLDPRAPLHIAPRLDLALLTWMWRFHAACRADRLRRAMGTLIPLGRLSLAAWEEILDETGIDCRWRREGYHAVYLTERGRRAAEAEASLLAGMGIRVRSLAGDELRAEDPAFRDEVRGAVHYEESVSLDPALLPGRLAEALVARGVEVRHGARAAGVLVEGGRCRGVRLADGQEILADETVLAAGVWTAQLARTAGLSLPMQAGKGYHLELGRPARCPRRPCVLCESMVAVTPLADRLRLAGTVELSGVNLTLRRERLTMLRRGAARYLRGTEEPAERGSWCGLRPLTADGLPVIGPAPGVRGLYAATGHAKMGMLLGPGSGRLVAESILDGRPSLDLGALSWDRA